MNADECTPSPSLIAPLPPLPPAPYPADISTLASTQSLCPECEHELALPPSGRRTRFDAWFRRPGLPRTLECELPVPYQAGHCGCDNPFHLRR
ncbi:MAG: hypothetical protein JWQ43_1804 [Glaciihabitans sp.]|nr:hypothetical protein [Glaciihabitans sp.]